MDWAIVGINDIVCANDETAAIIENRPKRDVLPIVKEEPADNHCPEPSRRVYTEEEENGNTVVVIRYLFYE